MPAAASAGPGSVVQPGQGGGVPFLAATYDYSEPMFTDTATPGAATQSFLHNVTPGGFLRGITLSVSTTSNGSGISSFPDSPWCILSNIFVESIDGTPIKYPVGGYAEYLISRYTRPWDEDPAQDPGFLNTASTVAFRLRLFVESRMTIGVLPNTDARAQYRIGYTVNTSANSFASASTSPGLTINGYLETYAQPDKANAMGQPNQQAPDGLAFQRFTSHQIFPTTGGDQTFQSNRVGNLVRTIALVVRASGTGGGGGNGARTDLTTDPIRWRVDNSQILVENRDRRDYEMFRFFGAPGELSGTGGSRPTGVYVYPRWHNPGARDGQPWLPTTQASYLQYELNGSPSGGSLEIITEDLAPTVQTPPGYLLGL